MNIFALNDLRQQAEHAAEQDMGIESCPYPADSPAAIEWVRIYCEAEATCS